MPFGNPNSLPAAIDADYREMDRANIEQDAEDAALLETVLDRDDVQIFMRCAYQCLVAAELLVKKHSRGLECNDLTVARLDVENLTKL